MPSTLGVPRASAQPVRFKGARSTENLFKHADADGDGFVRDDEYFQHMVTRTAPLEWGEVGL